MKLEAVEWTALASAALLLSLRFFSDWLYIEFWFLGALLTFVVWVVAGLVAVFSIGWAFDGHEHPVRRGLAMPLTLLLVFFLSHPVGSFGRLVFARMEIAENRHLIEAEAALNPGRAISIPYIDGIPDGGVAIIRSAVDPRSLPAEERMRLVGETMHHCSSVKEGYFACSYD